MPVTPAKARKLALSLEGASEVPHFHLAAFRTPRKIFATLSDDDSLLNLMFDPDLRDFYSEHEPDAFRPIPGGWGRMGMTHCDLKQVDEATLLGALKAAHELARLKAKTRRKKKT